MRTGKLVIGLAALVTLGACATKQKRGAAIGAGSGAAAGAVIGGLAGGGKGALAGAGIGGAAGAITGAIIGDYMDKQERELRENVDSARIERKGDRLLLVFNSQILFDVDRTELKAGAEQDLVNLAEVLKQYPETDLVIEGHTDATGSQSYNEQLSLRRAQAVIDFLGNKGVDRERLTPQAMGEAQPVATNDSTAGRQQNRRVEVEIRPNAELRSRDSAAARRPGRGG